jgi:hypothetical protein
MQTEVARSQTSWWEAVVEWLFMANNWPGSIVALVLTNALLMLIAWLIGFVVVPEANVTFALWVTGVSLGLDAVLLFISFVKHGELREGTLGFYMGSLIGLVAMCLVWLVLGAIWLGVQSLAKFTLPPSLALVTISTLVIGMLFGLLFAAVASSD